MNTVQDAMKWQRRLDIELSGRQSDFRRFSEYYDGKHRLLYSSDKWRASFGAIFRDFADNWCELVVDSVEERINVTGFRYGDKGGDTAAWDIWQANDMDALSQIIHTESLVQGHAYVMVWADDDEEGRPEITIESPSQVIVASSAVDRDLRICAYKRWIDEDGFGYATIYFPDLIYKFRSKTKVQTTGNWTVDERSWEYREVGTEPWPLPNPLGVVPIVQLINRPRMALKGYEPFVGKSEIKQIIPIQDAINKTLLDMMIASEFGSFRQRWATGLEIPVDPISKQPVEPYKIAVDRLWINENPDGKFGDFGETDLAGYVKAVELLVQHIASQTRTPPHYFYLSGNFPSGESIKSAETGLVSKARRKMRHYSDAWETVMRLCFMVQGDARGKVTNAEVIWADPESHSEAELADALVKKQAIGIPEEQLWEDAGYSPQQIRRFKQMKLQEAMTASVMAPSNFGQLPPTPGSPPVPPNNLPPVLPPTAPPPPKG